MKKTIQSNNKIEIGSEIQFVALSRHTGEVYPTTARVIDRRPCNDKGDVWEYTIVYKDQDEN